MTGGFRSGPAMLAALRSGATDMIGMARPLAVVPDLPNRLLAHPDEVLRLPRVSTGIIAVDRLAMLDITWYEAQLDWLARGRAPQSDLSAWRAVLLTAQRAGIHAFHQRRA